MLQLNVEHSISVMNMHQSEKHITDRYKRTETVTKTSQKNSKYKNGTSTKTMIIETEDILAEITKTNEFEVPFGPLN